MAAWVEGINALSALWADAMSRVLWQGGAALLAVALVCRLAPRVPAHLQCWLWRLAYLKLYVAMLGLAPVELPLLPPVVPVPQPDAAPMPFSGAEVPMAAFPAPVAGALPPAASTPAIEVSAWLAVAWLGVLGWWLVRIRGQYRETHRIRASARPLQAPVIAAQAAELGARLGLRAVPEVLVTGEARGPFLAGVLRPAVILPHALVEGAEPEELRLVLAHELGHLKRRDLPWTWLPTLAQGLFPFHPLVWWAQREWSIAVETACDELVLRETAAPPARYARMLLDSATRFGGDTQLRLTTVGVVGSCRSLRRRLQMMHYVRPLSRRRQRLMTTVLVAVGGIALVPWRVVAAPAVPEPAAEAAPAVTPVPAPSARPAGEAPAAVRQVKRARAARAGKGEPVQVIPPAPAAPVPEARKARGDADDAKLPLQPGVLPASPRPAPLPGAPLAVRPVPAAPVPPAPVPAAPVMAVPPPALPEATPAPAQIRAEKRGIRPARPALPAAPVPAVEPAAPAFPAPGVAPAPASPAASSPTDPAEPGVEEPGVPFLKDLPYVGRLFRNSKPSPAAAEPAMGGDVTPRRKSEPRPTRDPNGLPAAPAPYKGDRAPAQAEAPGDSRIEVFSLRHFHVNDMRHLLQTMSGVPTGIRQITADERTNGLLMQGSAASLEQLKTAIRLLDVPMQLEKGWFRIRLKPVNAKLDELHLQVLALPGAQEAEREPDALVLRGSDLWVRQAMAVAARMEMGLGIGLKDRIRWRDMLTPGESRYLKSKEQYSPNELTPKPKPQKLPNELTPKPKSRNGYNGFPLKDKSPLSRLQEMYRGKPGTGAAENLRKRYNDAGPAKKKDGPNPGKPVPGEEAATPQGPGDASMTPAPIGEAR